MSSRYTPPDDFEECDLAKSLHRFGQIVLVLQGGGALGAYHGGVYEALAEAGVEPDWIVGTSIGAINGALIAGNRKGTRLDRLKQFWKLIEYEWPVQAARMFPFFGAATANFMTMAVGNPEFFVPNPLASLAMRSDVGPEKAAFYTVDPLKKTLDDLIEADEFRRWPTRLTVGAAKVTTSEMVYFDSDDLPLTIDHILASGALPPAFPAVRIDGAIYWDGGILSNTPLEIVLEEHRRRPVLVIEVQLWDPVGPEPRTIMQGFTREKDVRYSSRATIAIERHKELLRLRTMIGKLVKHLPEGQQADPEVRRIAAESQSQPLHVVRLLAPRLANEDYNKDIDFSREGIEARWSAGLSDMQKILDLRPWEQESGDLEGIVIHETQEGTMLRTR